MKLTDKEIQRILEELTNNFNEVYPKYNKIQALLSFPSGEIMNPNISGYLLGWKLANKIRLGCPITLDDGFDAQGLEGCVRVETDLINALLAYRELPKYRRNLRTLQNIR